MEEAASKLGEHLVRRAERRVVAMKNRGKLCWVVLVLSTMAVTVRSMLTSAASSFRAEQFVGMREGRNRGLTCENALL
jgi:hypothetical protein